ncbi:nucleotidyl transferase AbiEii/AbiGii toxin family protein [Acidothermaceae bacterium B102]|nr:nucleotidyl transferase AbiEii/AbiGii toxin family protein [Acidothermaceae bacterium B102]
MPGRDTAEGRAYLDLQAKAKIDNRPTDELLSLYALEGFLARLAASPYATTLVLKGGVLLAAFDARRPTRDVDLQAQAMANDTLTVRSVISEIAAIPDVDGLVYDHASATAVVIRDDDEYSGVRVSMTCQLATAKIAFHVDFNVGDPIQPAPQTVAVPRILGGADIELLGYPMSMVHAEKIITALSRGTANTRWRDFGDVFVLSGQHPVDGHDLTHALRTVADHRLVTMEPLGPALVGYASVAQPKWAAWRTKNDRGELPASFGALLETLYDFTDPALAGQVAESTWNPQTRRWF